MRPLIPLIKANLVYPVYIVLAHISISTVLCIKGSTAHLLGLLDPSKENPLVINTKAKPIAVLTLYKGLLHIAEPGSIRYLDVTRQKSIAILCIKDISQKTWDYWLLRLLPLLILLNPEVLYTIPYKIHKSKLDLNKLTLYKAMGQGKRGLLGLYSIKRLGSSLEFEEETRLKEETGTLSYFVYNIILVHKELESKELESKELESEESESEGLELEGLESEELESKELKSKELKSKKIPLRPLSPKKNYPLTISSQICLSNKTAAILEI
jgi:hypothetical protein